MYVQCYVDTQTLQDPGSPPAHRKNAQIQNLEKQLAIEQRVKSGAETMITMYTNPKSKHERKLLNEAQQMLSDSKTKVEVLRMKIMRLNVMGSSHKEEENERSQKVSKSTSSQLPEGRVSMLRYRIDVETRLMQGARSIIKANPKAKSSQSVRMLK
jgi:protein kinase N